MAILFYWTSGKLTQRLTFLQLTGINSWRASVLDDYIILSDSFDVEVSVCACYNHILFNRPQIKGQFFKEMITLLLLDKQIHWDTWHYCSILKRNHSINLLVRKKAELLHSIPSPRHFDSQKCLLFQNIWLYIWGSICEIRYDWKMSIFLLSLWSS